MGALNRLRTLGSVGALGLRGAQELLRPPFAWRAAVLPELATALRRAILPAVVLVAALGVALPGVQLGDFLANNGQIDRLGAHLTTTGLRWLGPLAALGALVIGPGGSLTARLARSGAGEAEEVRTFEDAGQFVAARVIAFAAAAAALLFLIVPAGVAAGMAVAVFVFEVPAGVVAASLFDAARFGDLLQGLVSALVSGALAGLVCSYYGLEAAWRRQQGETDAAARGGAAVRNALVAALFVVAFVNVVLAAYLLAAFPDIRFTR